MGCSPGDGARRACAALHAGPGREGRAQTSSPATAGKPQGLKNCPGNEQSLQPEELVQRFTQGLGEKDVHRQAHLLLLVNLKGSGHGIPVLGMAGRSAVVMFVLSRPRDCTSSAWPLEAY